MSVRNQWIMIALLSIILVVGAGYGLRWFLEPPKSTLDYCRTHCGLDVNEIHWLIETAKSAKTNRREAMEAFRRTFDDDPEISDPGLCEPCALAILEAAGIVD